MYLSSWKHLPSIHVQGSWLNGKNLLRSIHKALWNDKGPSILFVMVLCHTTSSRGSCMILPWCAYINKKCITECPWTFRLSECSDLSEFYSTPFFSTAVYTNYISTLSIKLKELSDVGGLHAPCSVTAILDYLKNWNCPIFPHCSEGVKLTICCETCTIKKFVKNHTMCQHFFQIKKNWNWLNRHLVGLTK